MVPLRGTVNLVVVSSYWTGDKEEDAVEINEDSTNPLVYKYDLRDRALQRKLGERFYNLKFKSHGDAAMLEAVKKALKDGGVKYRTGKRGLDNGVFGVFPLQQAQTDPSPVQGHVLG